MIGRVRDWLPSGVITDDVVLETVKQAVARWSERWFTGTYATVAAVKPVSGDPRNEKDDAGWRVWRTAIAVRGSRPAMSRAVDKALDITAPIPALTEADQNLISGFERKLLEDLAQEIEQAFGLPGEIRSDPQKVHDPLADEGGLLATVTDPAGREILTLAVPADVIVAKVKAHLGPPRRRAEVLEPLVKPLGSVNVAIEALVGGVELTLAELGDLAVGDVLILDRTLDQAVEIAGVEGREVFAKANLTSMDDGIALVFSA